FAFTPDSRTLASASAENNARQRNAVVLWNVDTGQERGRLQTESQVSAVAFSEDGNLLASADQIGMAIKLWEAYDGPELATIRDCRGPVAYSPDGKTLASASSGRVILRNAATGEERIRLWGHDFPITSLAFSRDGKSLIAGSLLDEDRLL